MLDRATDLLESAGVQTIARAGIRPLAGLKDSVASQNNQRSSDRDVFAQCQASDKNRSALEEEGHLGRLHAYRKNRVKQALTIIAEALRALSGLGLFSVGS